VDYRDLLGATDTRVLPHLGGRRVEGPRPIRLDAALAPGWYAFSLQGRKVRGQEPADPDDELLEGLVAVRGHLVGETLALSDGTVRPLHLMPEWRPERFAPVVARVWADSLVFHSEAFEDEAESAVRDALDAADGLAGIKGVPSSLRAAFALEVLNRVSEDMGVPFHAVEARGQLRKVAEEGDEAARAWLLAVQEARAAQRREEEQALRVAERQARRDRHAMAAAAERVRELERRGRRWQPFQAPRNRRRAQQVGQLENRIDQVLHAAGATLLEVRTLGDGLVDVRWRLDDITLLTMVQQDTLQVVDSGVCLSGSDDLVTLESLPGVIDEAVRTNVLFITRRS
jgi:hypothetical protein